MKSVTARRSTYKEILKKQTRDPWAWILILSLLSAILSVVAAIGPSRHESTKYSWPSTLETTELNVQDNVTSGTELLLVDHDPASLHVLMDCLPSEGLVFKTSLHPEHTGGLLIERTDQKLQIWIGSTLLSDPAWSPSFCNNEFRIENSSWTLIQNGVIVDQGISEKAPIVSALVAPTELLATKSLSVELETKTHGTSPTSAQYATWFGSAAFLLAAIVVAAWPSLRISNLNRIKILKRNPILSIDLGVVISILAIMGLGLTNYDDGWVLTTATQWTGSGIFPQYYEKFNTFVPLGWLHDLIYLGLGNASRNIWWLRLPALLSAIGGWIAIRSVFSLIVEKKKTAAWFILASSYLLGIAAWHVTLRPEPMVALLGSLILLLTIKFVQSKSPALLMFACLLAVLSITIHTSGIVTFAPLVAILPFLLKSFFTNRDISGKVLFSIVASSICVFFLFVFVDTDLNRWLTNREDMAQLGAGYHQKDWTDEITRYDILFRHVPYNNPVRIFTVLLGFVGLISNITRPKNPKRPELNIVSDSLLFAFLLLLLTPSKWPWHFGALVPFLAAGFAAEVIKSTLSSDKEHEFSAFRFAVLSTFAFMIAQPSAYDWFSSIWTWLGTIFGAALLWTIIQLVRKERTQVNTTYLALSIGVLGASCFIPKFLFLFVLLTFASIKQLDVSAKKVLVKAAKWTAPTLLLATLFDLIFDWFNKEIYAPGGIQRVYDGFKEMSLLPALLIFFLGVIYLRAKKYLRNRQSDTTNKPLPVVSSMFLIAGALFVGSVTWDGAHNTGWTTSRQSLWDSAGLSPCGLPATLGYHDPNLAKPLEELKDFYSPQEYQPPGAKNLPLLTSPNNSVRSISGTPTPKASLLGTYDQILEEEATGWFSTPWYLIPKESERIYFETTGRVTPEDGTRANEIELQFATINDGEITDFTSSDSGANHDSVRWQTSEIQLTPGRWNAMRAVAIDRQETSSLGFSNLRAVGARRNFQATMENGHYDESAWITPRLVLQFPCLKSSKIAHGRAEAPDLIVDFLYIEDSPFEYMFDVYDYSPNNIIRGNLLRLKLRDPDWLDVPFSYVKQWS